jgi:hypothetical protein
VTDQPPEIIIAPPPDTAAAAGGVGLEATGQLLRPGRMLLGWLAQEHGEALLASQAGGELTEQQREQVRRAHAAVAARPEDVDQAELITELPAELAEHLARLQTTPAGASMLQEGWQVEMVDLTRVCAFQPWVGASSAADRMDGLRADDLPAIAEITLPTSPTPTSVRYHLDQAKQVYTIVSPNPNLQVLRPLDRLQVPPDGAPGFGFVVAAPMSFLQIARFQGRWFARDGYHRAVGLLARGISHAPAFVRDLDTIEALVPPKIQSGMLPQGAYLGARPPVLADYHDDTVAVSARMPVQQKVILVQALEHFV